jgi:hypothetical protein
MEKADKSSGIGYQKGCPACEQNDPELERELETFAQLLVDIYLDKKNDNADLKSTSAGCQLSWLPLF